MISFAARIAVAPDVLFRMLGDEGVLVNLRTEQYLGVNEIGARMWQALGASASIEDAFDQLAQEYEVEPAQLRTDLVEFIDLLLGQHLIEVREAEEPPPTA
ncbi:MAG: PqqD family protein [Vicinamibacterales bacterium]